MFFKNRQAADNTLQIVIAVLLSMIALAYPVYQLSKGLLDRFRMLGREM